MLIILFGLTSRCHAETLSGVYVAEPGIVDGKVVVEMKKLCELWQIRVVDLPSATIEIPGIGAVLLSDEVRCVPFFIYYSSSRLDVTVGMAFLSTSSAPPMEGLMATLTDGPSLDRVTLSFKFNDVAVPADMAMGRLVDAISSSLSSD